jgi:ribosomal protein S18 acetylase RimI-like enzyme
MTVAVQIQARSEANAKHLFDDAFCKVPDQVRTGIFRANLPDLSHWKRMLELGLSSRFGAEFYLARFGDRVVGRIGCNISPSNPELGYIGFFEVDLSNPQLAADLAQLLISTAINRLRSNGVKDILGPVDISTWLNYRFFTESHPSNASRFFSWEPVNPLEYPRFFSAAGFREIDSFRTQGYPTDSADELLMATMPGKALYDRALAAGFCFETLDPLRSSEDQVRLLYGLTSQGFSGHRFWEPISFEAFNSIYAAGFRRYKESLCYLARTPSNEPAGYVFAFPDEDAMVLKTIAVLPEYRRRGIAVALIYMLAVETHRRGIRHGVIALVRAGSMSERLEDHMASVLGGTWTHHYRLYEYR